MTNARKTPRAFTLPDTLVGIALSLVTLTLSVPVVQWCSVGLHRDEAAASAAASFDQALKMLRQDIWQASKIDRPAKNRLLLTSPAGKIAWQFDSDGAVRRQGPAGPERRWQRSAPAIGIEQDGAVITVTLPDSSGRRGFSLAMISPASLYSEGGEPHP